MKAVRVAFIVLAAALVAVGVSTTSYAFHSGGVAECSGCHSMHSAPTPLSGIGGNLLVSTSKSGACLTCHQHTGDTGPSSYHISTADADMPVGTAPLQRTPGGDFGWLKKTYTWAARTAGDPPEEEHGDRHGHNVVAPEFGYGTDLTNATAPGGTFSSANLACHSCHDPHGKYRRDATAADVVVTSGAAIRASGSYNGTNNEPISPNAVGAYRLLAGSGYAQGAAVIGYPGVPSAKAPSNYNRTEATTQTRVAYGDIAAAGNTSWSQWCGTCHGGMHNAGNIGAKYVHPTNFALGSLAGNYDLYVKSGQTNGTHATSFTSLVPFIESTTTAGSYATLAGHADNTSTYQTGPDTTDKVSCLTCHRAHASGWEFAIRWNPEYEFLTQNGLYPNGSFAGRGHTSAEVEDAYYDRPASVFANYQRSLCNKCHMQD